VRCHRFPHPHIKASRVNRYIKFPQMWWLTLQARPATAADWKVAMALLEKAKFSPVVRFSNEAADKLGISRQTKWRSLDRLARWGLIVVQSKVGRSPRVTVKC
jgi:predicted DNA-binding protein (UPF0251 family)